MKKNSRRIEWLVVGGIAILMSALNQLHVIREWLTNPPDRYFTGIAHYFADFFLYAAQMKQGAGGSLLYSHRFTNESVPPTWIYWFNNLLGYIGHIFGLSPFATYDISLFLLVTLSILLFYYLLVMLYPTGKIKRIIALVFILTASPLFLFGSPGGLWFSPSLAFNRIGGVPHQVFQTILFILLAMSFSRKSLYIIPLAILASSANPIQMLIFVLAASVTTRVGIPLLVLLAVSFPVAWLTNQQFNSPVIAVSKVWETAQWVNRSLPFVLSSIGPILLFIPFGIAPFFRKFRPLNIMIFSYAAISFLLFFSPVPAILSTTPIRYLHPASYLLLPILGVEGIFALGKNRIGISLFILLYALLTIPSFAGELRGRLAPSTNPGVLMDTEFNHVPRPVAEALTWLGRQPTDPSRPVVLVDSRKRIELLVPAFADKTVFSGHPLHTLYPEVKEKLRRDFFEGSMTEDQQKQFLTNHRIGWIITPKKQIPFASLVFTNDELTIFTVK
ncbi:MAG: hypothetical protein AAB481_04735 [Patescibacteria group bacterium]